MNVQVRPVPPEDRPKWFNLYPLYQFDLSQFWPCPMNPYGVFDARPDIETLAQSAAYGEVFWQKEGWHPLWIVADEKIAGLAVVGQPSTGHVPHDVEHQLNEFWILPRYRERGVGSEAARQILRFWPGEWLVFVLRDNAPAQRFWKRVLREVAAGEVREDMDEEGFNWRFRVASLNPRPDHGKSRRRA